MRWSLLPTLLMLGSAPALAQTRVVTGTVVDSVSGEPIADARVTVRGTTLGSATEPTGRFTLSNVPQADVTLIIRRIGYRPVEMRVASTQSDVRASLARDRFQLSEVVVTGQATGVERRNLANAVTTVNAEEISRVSAQSVEHALQGKVPGALIATNSGAPGGGVQVRMRGVTSILGASEPLYVVDGTVLSNVAIPSNQNAVTGAASGSNPSLTQDAQVNRIADINPNDIENVEILKGASASAIYGSKASNGVIIITTRRGQPGARRINFTQRLGWSSLSNTVGSRLFETVQEATDTLFGYGPAAAAHFQPGRVFDQERELAGENPLSTETSLDISGGDEDTRYFASGLWKDDGGIIRNTGFEKQSVRANLDQDLGSRLSLSAQTNVIRTLAQRGLTNNDNLSVSFWMVFPFTPSFVDLRPGPDGLYPENPFVASNPLQTAALMKNDETVWRSIASGRLTFDAIRRPTYTLRLFGIGGVDYFSQENELNFPPELQFEDDDGQPGTSLLSNSHNLILNLRGSGVLTFTPANGLFTATTSAGVNSGSSDLQISRVVSRNLVGGLEIIGAGTQIQVREERQRVEDFSLFAQEEVLMFDERLLLTAGVTADRNSSNADTDKFFVYPKFSGSFRFVRPFMMVEELKLRAAYGQSGNQPLFGQKFTPLLATQNINGLPALLLEPGAVGARTASPDLHPERQHEFEGGLDVTLLNGRGQLELTGFRRDVTDLLLQRTLAPSSGFQTEIFNGGEMKTTGVEVGLSVVPFQSDDADWLFRTSYFSSDSKITELPVPPFRGLGFGTALGQFEFREGASVTAIVGNDTLPDGTRFVGKIGDANPDFIMSFSNNFRWRAFRLFGLLDWQNGGDVINLTKFLYDLGSNTADYDAPTTTCGAVTMVGACRLAVWPKKTGVYVEDASFVKLREITLGFELPPHLVSRFGQRVRSAEISLSGRNLATWTDYTGLDPEVSNFGNQPVGRNIDVAPFPPSRSFWLSARVGF